MPHATGPWKYGGKSDSCLDDDDEICSIVDANGEEVLGITWGGFACESDPHGAFPILYATEDVFRLILAAPQMLELLESLEWTGITPYADDRCCPWCMEIADGGPHLPDCRLAAILKLAKGEG